MAKLWAVIKREFMERVRTRWFLISTLLGPVFFAAITILPAWVAIREKGSSSVANVRIIDATGAGLGDRIAAALRDSTAAAGTPAPEVVTVAPSGVAQAESLATAAVVRKERRGYLVLDSATMAGREARYAGRNASSIADVERVRDAVRTQVTAFRMAREGLTPAQVAAINGPRLSLTTEQINDRGRGGSGTSNVIVAVAMGFLLYMMILLYGQNVLRSVLEEKTTRVAEVVVSSVKPEILMAGKVLGVGAVGLVQQVIWFAAAFYIGGLVAPILARMNGGAASGAATAAAAGGPPAGFDLHLGLGMVAAYLAFFLLGFLLYSALFAAVGAMVNSEQEAQQAAFPVMMPLIASAVLLQAVIRNPDSSLARFGSWFPLSAPIIMPMRMGMTNSPPLEVGLVLGGLVLTVVAAMWFAARVYRVGLLMYGKKPSFGEVLRWVRAA